MKWKVSYTYVNPGRGGPLRGKTIVESIDKPQRGSTFHAMFGLATIETVSKVKGQVA